MIKQNLSFDQLIDLFIRARAAMFDDRIPEPLEELGHEDDWLFVEVDSHTNKLCNGEFIDLLEKIIKIAKETYEYSALVVFGVASEFIMRRPTKKYNDIYPDTVVPLDLNEQEKKRLTNIILDLRNDLPEAHKYRADSLVNELIGK